MFMARHTDLYLAAFREVLLDFIEEVPHIIFSSGKRCNPFEMLDAISLSKTDVMKSGGIRLHLEKNKYVRDAG